MTQSDQPSALSLLLPKLDAPVSAGEPEASIAAAKEGDYSSTAVRTVSHYTFAIDQSTLQIVATRETTSYVADIEWYPEVFELAMVMNLLHDAGELEHHYRFVANKNAPNGYLNVYKTSESVALTDSAVFAEWYNKPSRKEGYTKGQLLDAKLARLSRRRASLQTEKGRLRVLRSQTSVPAPGGGGELTLGSNKEIAATEAAIETLNAEAIKLFHEIENALAHLNAAAATPTVSRWLVELPSPLGDITIHNPSPAEYMSAHGALRNTSAVVYGEFDGDEGEGGEE